MLFETQDFITLPSIPSTVSTTTITTPDYSRRELICILANLRLTLERFSNLIELTRGYNDTDDVFIDLIHKYNTEVVCPSIVSDSIPSINIFTQGFILAFQLSIREGYSLEYDKTLFNLRCRLQELARFAGMAIPEWETTSETIETEFDAGSLLTNNLSDDVDVDCDVDDNNDDYDYVDDNNDVDGVNDDNDNNDDNYDIDNMIRTEKHNVIRYTIIDADEIDEA